MRIGIDARMYGTANRGIGRYIEEMLNEILNKDKENEYFIFLYKCTISCLDYRFIYGNSNVDI